MIQANGGNDTMDMIGGIVDSTVYGGQGTDYISGVDGASTISGSLIAGNLGADSVILNSTTSIYNTEVYGSDSAGTDTGIRLHLGRCSHLQDHYCLRRCWC